MKNHKRWIAAALAMGVGLGTQSSARADGLYVKGAGKAAQTGQTSKHVAKPVAMPVYQQTQDVSVQPVTASVANVGDQTPEGTVVSVTPVYTPGEEPGKASFDGGHGPVAGHPVPGLGLGRPVQLTSEPTPIGVVQTNYNQASGRPPVGMPTDVMAHGRQAGMGAMPPGMMPPGAMPPGMMPRGQAPTGSMKPPRRGLMGLLNPRKAAAEDPYAVFNMSKSQRSMHTAMPLGPQAQVPPSSVPASAVYGQKPVH